jgi:hypothetical protein
VIMTTGMDAKNNLYLIDYWRRRETNPVNMLIQLLLHVGRFHPTRLVIETNAFQDMFSKLFQYWRSDREKLKTILEMEKVSEEDIRMVLNAWLPPVVEVTQVKNKTNRILSLQPRFRTHTIYHKPHMREFVEEAKDFPEGKHDDIVDALQMCDSVSHGASVASVEHKKAEPPSSAYVMRDGSPIRYTDYIPSKRSAWI